MVCAAISSNVKLASAPGNVLMSSRVSGLPKPSVVNVSQIVTVDKAVLTDRVKRLDERVIAEVESGIRLVLKL